MSHYSPTTLETRFTEATIRALLRTQGYLVAGQLLAAERCSRLADDIQSSAARGPRLSGSGGATRAIALLSHSDLALELLDDEALGALVDEALGDDLILSRAEGVIGPPTDQAAWQSDFDKLRRSLSTRSFRPGIAVWIPLGVGGGQLEVLRASQQMDPTVSPAEAGLPSIRLSVSQGCAVLLEGGVCYRLLMQKSPWMCLAFVRPWIKPEVLLFSALGEERLNRLGQRGRRWCGAHLGLPTSVEEFLAIEAAALESDFGRAKGSGI